MVPFMINLLELDKDLHYKIYHLLTIQSMMMLLYVLKKWNSQENQVKDIGLEKTNITYIILNNTIIDIKSQLNFIIRIITLIIIFIIDSIVHFIIMLFINSKFMLVILFIMLNYFKIIMFTHLNYFFIPNLILLLLLKYDYYIMEFMINQLVNLTKLYYDLFCI